MWDPGADYGAKGLIQSMESSNALRDGGVFGYRRVGPRQMSFPLLLRDVSGQTLLQTESLLRNWTTAGAKVAVQTETTPSGQAVFFDVLDGRWEPDYDGFENRAGRRKGTLYLDTQPWGYWPTEMLLASSASVGNVGALAVNGASIIGDVPPLAHISVMPTVASYYMPSFTGFAPSSTQWNPDMLALSLAARPSFTAFIPAGQWLGCSYLDNGGGRWTPTLRADPLAPGSQAWAWSGTTAQTFSSLNLAAVTASMIPTALEPAYRGRFRAFALLGVRANPTPAALPTSIPWTALLDAEPMIGTVGGVIAMASSNQIATIPQVFTNGQGSSFVASFIYWTLDMGEITLPPAASGAQAGTRLRLWIASPSQQYQATPLGAYSFGGVYLLPVDGPAGILTSGMWAPSLTAGVPGNPLLDGATQAGVEFNQNYVDSVMISRSFPPPAAPWRDARSQYRGLTMRLGASTSTLNILTADRLAALGRVVAPLGATYPVAQGSLEYAQVSVSYRPTFSFLYGI